MVAGELTERQLGAILVLGKIRKHAVKLRTNAKDTRPPVSANSLEKDFLAGLKEITVYTLDDVIEEIDKLIMEEGKPYFYQE